MMRGVLRDVARQNGETWSTGDNLWALSGGSISHTRPDGPLPLVFVGTVFETIGVLHSVVVDVRVLPSLGELSGVSVEAPADKDAFLYNGTTHLWVPRQIDHNADLAGLSVGDYHPQYGPVQAGFVDRSKCTIAFTDGSPLRTLTVSVVAGQTLEFWSDGTRFVYTDASGPWTVQIADTEGVWYFYFNGASALVATQAITEEIFTRYALVAFAYWDAASNAHLMFADERHGREMDGATHLHLHRTLGTGYDSGLGLGDIIADASGDLDAHIQCSVANGVIRDEDLRHAIEDGSPQNLSAPAEIPLFYRSGASGFWRLIAATGELVTPTGTGRAAWNNPNAGGAGVWGLSEVASTEYVLTHLFATGDVEHPIIGIIGQDDYPTLAQAQDGALVELRDLQLGDLTSLTLEFRAIATLIFQTQNGYANSVKSRIRSTAEGDPYIDWRREGGGPAGGTSVSAHNNLTGIQGGTVSERYHLTSAEHDNVTKRSFGIVIDGGGSPITAGVKGFLQLPFSGIITRWTLMADQVGSIVLDLWKDTFASAPPTVADTITGSEKPTLASDQFAEDTDLATWDVQVEAGDVVAFNVDSAATVQRVALSVWVETGG
jgi:hypothetical protein